ncbi:MAG: hypothetical protein WBB19_09800 [Desulforhopalus sp.]
MRTFFYSVKKSNCGERCHWQVCSQKYLSRLRAMQGLENIHTLFGEIFYRSPPLDTTPRNGDIIILYAESAKELDVMIAARDGFDGLRRILVVADPMGVDGQKYHLLAPRFITQAQRNVGELEAVVRKMKRNGQ